MIVRSMPATAPGLVTRSLRLGNLTFMPIFEAMPVAWLRYSDLSPCRSAAMARISGPKLPVIFWGSLAMRSWRKEGRCVYADWSWCSELVSRDSRSS